MFEVKVGNDQGNTQSEGDSHSKNRGGKNWINKSGTYTKRTYRKPSEQLFSRSEATQLPKFN